MMPRQTDSWRPPRAHKGIQLESKAHRSVAFVLTLLTFYLFTVLITLQATCVNECGQT
jgi:hypothetical protein